MRLFLIFALFFLTCDAFATSGAGSDDTVGTVNIPMTMTLSPGFTTWVSGQDFFTGLM